MLAKKYRLTKNGSFTYVYKHGMCRKAACLSLVCVKGGKAVKIGFSVPNKIGKAVIRNKIKRRLRAAAAVYIKNILPTQMVMTVKNGIENYTFKDIVRIMGKQLREAGLVNEEKNLKNN